MRAGNRTRHTRSLERLYLSSYRIIELLAKPLGLSLIDKTSPSVLPHVGLHVLDLVNWPVCNPAQIGQQARFAHSVVHLRRVARWICFTHGWNSIHLEAPASWSHSLIAAALRVSR